MYRYELNKQFEKYYNSGYDPDLVPNHNVQDKRYVSLLTSMSHTYGNIFAFVQNWLINIFPKDLFKTIHVNSKIAHRQIRSTTHEYVKKTKPIIIFRPRIGDVNDERFLKNTLMIERMADIYSSLGGTNLVSFFNDPKHDLSVKFQLNRSVFYIDVILIFDTLMQEIDYMHYIQNAVRIGHNFNLSTYLESYIPQES